MSDRRICRVVNVVTVPDGGNGSFVFSYNEYLSNPIRTVPALESVKFQNVDVDGIRLQVAVSRKTPTIAIRNVGGVLEEV